MPFVVESELQGVPPLLADRSSSGYSPQPGSVLRLRYDTPIRIQVAGRNLATARTPQSGNKRMAARGQ